MFTIEIAGLKIGVWNQFSFAQKYCEGYEAAKEGKLDFEVRPSLSDIEEKRERSRLKGRREYPLYYYESEAIFSEIARRLGEYDALFLHSCLLEVQGKGFGLVAGSGGGKTVQMQLFRKALGDQVKVLNGDKPVYRLQDGKLYGYGTPWRGKEAVGERGSTQVRALFFLEKRERDSLRPLSYQEVMERIFLHMEPPRVETADALASVLSRILQGVACYELGATKNGGSVDLVRSALSQLP